MSKTKKKKNRKYCILQHIWYTEIISQLIDLSIDKNWNNIIYKKWMQVIKEFKHWLL